MSPAALRPRARAWADLLHRWIGFTAGAALVVIGLTGSLLAFYVEIERSFYPHMQPERAHALPSSYEAVYQRLVRLPVDPPGGAWKIEIPPDGGVITSRYSAPGAPTRMVTLDPTTLEVLRDAHWNSTFFTWIYDVHEYLQLGSGARPWIGYVALVMVLGFLTGVGSWLLPRGSLRAKLRIKRHTTASRRTYDVHKLVGASALLFLILTVGTGALISMPDQFRVLLNAFSPLKPSEPDVESTPHAGDRRLTVDDVLARGPEQFPGSRVVWVRVPTAPTDTYDLQIRQAGAPMTRFPRTHLFIDQYTNRVLSVYDPKSDGMGDMVLNWLVPLHDGKAFGMVGRVLVMVVGLVPSVMFVTGFMRWKQKRTARNAAKRFRARIAREAIPFPSARDSGSGKRAGVTTARM